MSETKPKGTILVVDDSRESLELISIYLSGHGYQVVKAAGGRLALEEVAKRPPDVIILDIMMPDMDGYEVTTALKRDAANQRIPIILASARSTADDVLAGLVVGADDYITKPFDLDILLARIQIQLRVRGLRERLASLEAILDQAHDGLSEVEAAAQRLADSMNGGDERPQAEDLTRKLGELRDLVHDRPREDAEG